MRDWLREAAADGIAPELLDAIQAVLAEDFDAVESARGQLQDGDLSWIAACYGRLETWHQKGLLVMLVADAEDRGVHAPVFRAFLKDGLAAPELRRFEGWESYATAIAALEGDLDRFEHWCASPLDAALERARALLVEA